MSYLAMRYMVRPEGVALLECFRIQPGSSVRLTQAYSAFAHPPYSVGALLVFESLLGV